MAPLPERTVQQRKPLTLSVRFMQRIISCAISAMLKLLRKRYVKRFTPKSVTFTNSESRDH
jgi:hypothetical protein